MSAGVNEGAFDIYRDTLADLYDVSDVAPEAQKNFISRTKITRFGGSTLGKARSIAQTLTRDAAAIRRSGLDHVSIIVNFSNSAGDFDGRNGRADPGSVQFRDLSRPSRSRGANIDMINMMVPRHQMPTWLLAAGFHGLTMPGHSAGARLVASHLTTLFQVGDDLTEDEGIAAVEATFVIAERFLGRRRPVPTAMQTDAVQRTIRRRAMHIFDTHNDSRNLTAGKVAAMIGVSRSSLFRAFEAMGGVMTYVRHRRLDRVYVALRATGATSSALSDLAEQQGFGSARQMNVAFRARFGFSLSNLQPSSLARLGRSPLSRNSSLDSPAHDVFLDWLRIGETI